MSSRWPDDVLLQARLQGDADADRIIAAILNPPAGSSGQSLRSYNHLLGLANTLVANPELGLISGSLLRREFDDSGEAGRYFEPAEAPDWVDEAKLALATNVWRVDSILAIAVLYAASLPACYLMKKGVPALYRTEKLAEQEYIFQRIFETGLMLEDVMKPGGITVVRDNHPNPPDLLADVLRQHDPEGEWSAHFGGLRRAANAPGTPPDPEAVRRDFDASRSQSKRFIWGGGYMAARKVRFLHSAMRLMLQNPAGAHPPTGDPKTFMEHAARTPAWDVAELGVPINQEDLAFVLLTFGYLIPKGMETWGRVVPRAEREAFLHLWRVVGHVMGIREDLMTDNLDEAAALYEQILRRNGGASDLGQILTNAEMSFLRNYIPAWFGIDRIIPASLIIDQLGPEHAAMIINKDDYRRARRPLARMTHAVARSTVKCYFWVRQHILRHVPVLGGVVTTITENSSNTLIDSWRDSFRREPFYIPTQATRWMPDRGVTPEYKAKLQRWRQKLFDTMLLGVASLVVAGFGIAAAIAMFFMDMPRERNLTGAAGLAIFLFGVFILTVWLPRVSSHRPALADEPPSRT
jgi:hypothetical protein